MFRWFKPPVASTAVCSKEVVILLLVHSVVLSVSCVVLVLLCIT